MKSSLIAIIVVIIFAITMMILRLANLVPQDIYGILFDWLVGTATLAAVAVSLYFGVTSLRQTRDIQMSERKQRLVKEIEAWSKELISFIDAYEIAAQENPWNLRQARWHILRATKNNMEEAANEIEKAFGEKVKNAITAFDNLDRNIDLRQPTTRNISNELERCKRSCEEILQSTGSLKFKAKSGKSCVIKS